MKVSNSKIVSGVKELVQVSEDQRAEIFSLRSQLREMKSNNERLKSSNRAYRKKICDYQKQLAEARTAVVVSKAVRVLEAA